MGKKLYQLFNDMEVDLAEYEELDFSDYERAAAKQRILREVKRMGQSAGRDKTKRSRGRKWKLAAGVAAACALTVGAVGIANPILAKNLFGGLFGQLIDSAKGEKYEEERTAIYSKIGEKSVDAKEEALKQADAQEYAISAEDHGVTISVSDIYCDGYVLYYTASLKTDDEGLSQADGILTASKELGSDELKVEGRDMSGSSKGFERTEGDTFVTASDINLLNEGFEAGDQETIVVDWKITNLTGRLWDRWDEQGEYEMTGMLEGEWHLRFPVTVDLSENEAFAIDREEDGFAVKDAVKTKAGLVVHVKLPDLRQAPYNDPHNDPDFGIKDAQGKALQWLAQRHEQHEDGTQDVWIMVLYNGEQELSFDVNAKDEEAAELASIAFQIP